MADSTTWQDVPVTTKAVAARDGFYSFLIVMLLMLLVIVITLTVTTNRELILIKTDFSVGTVVRPYSLAPGTTATGVNKLLVISPSFQQQFSSVTMFETNIAVTTSVDGLVSTLTGPTSRVTALSFETPDLDTGELRADFLTVTDPAFFSSTSLLTNYWFPLQQDLQSGLCLGTEPNNRQLIFVNPRSADSSAYGVVNAARWLRQETTQAASVGTFAQLSFPSATLMASDSNQTNSPSVSLVNSGSPTNTIGLLLPTATTYRFYIDASVTVPTDGTVFYFALQGGGLTTTPNENQLLQFQYPSLADTDEATQFFSRTYIATTANSSPVYLKITRSTGTSSLVLHDWNVMVLSV